MRIRWVDGCEVSVIARDGQTTISANREGMLTLANILTDLADEQPGAHVHLDEHNCLEDGSNELVVEHIP